LTDQVAAEEEGRKVTTEDETAYRSASVGAATTLQALAATVPQTAAGICAVLGYFADNPDLSFEEPEVIEACIRSIVASPVLAGGANV
jgi:hypothetical protein